MENNIPNSKYQNLFYEADIIILPYDKGIYNESTSGIFTEAIFEFNYADEQMRRIGPMYWGRQDHKNFRF